MKVKFTGTIIVTFPRNTIDGRSRRRKEQWTLREALIEAARRRVSSKMIDGQYLELERFEDYGSEITVKFKTKEGY